MTLSPYVIARHAYVERLVRAIVAVEFGDWMDPPNTPLALLEEAVNQLTYADSDWDGEAQYLEVKVDGFAEEIAKNLEGS